MDIAIVLLILGCILLIAILLFVMEYLILLIKRLCFILKIKNISQKNNIDCKVKSYFRSVFIRGKKPDISIGKNGEKYNVFVISTIFRRVRYHFESADKIVIYKIGKMTVPRNKLSMQFDHKSFYSLYENKMMSVKNFIVDDSENNIFLVFPVPLQITAIKDNKLVRVYDGDRITNTVFYSGNGFREWLSGKT